MRNSRYERLAGFDVNGYPARCERFARYVLYIGDGSKGALFWLLSKFDIQVFVQCHGYSFFDNAIANLISKLVRNYLAGQLMWLKNFIFIPFMLSRSIWLRNC